MSESNRITKEIFDYPMISNRSVIFQMYTTFFVEYFFDTDEYKLHNYVDILNFDNSNGYFREFEERDDFLNLIDKIRAPERFMIRENLISFNIDFGASFSGEIYLFVPINISPFMTRLSPGYIIASNASDFLDRFKERAIELAMKTDPSVFIELFKTSQIMMTSRITRMITEYILSTEQKNLIRDLIFIGGSSQNMEVDEIDGLIERAFDNQNTNLIVYISSFVNKNYTVMQNIHKNSDLDIVFYFERFMSRSSTDERITFMFDSLTRISETKYIQSNDKLHDKIYNLIKYLKVYVAVPSETKYINLFQNRTRFITGKFAYMGDRDNLRDENLIFIKGFPPMEEEKKKTVVETISLGEVEKVSQKQQKLTKEEKRLRNHEKKIAREKELENLEYQSSEVTSPTVRRGKNVVYYDGTTGKVFYIKRPVRNNVSSTEFFDNYFKIFEKEPVAILEKDQIQSYLSQAVDVLFFFISSGEVRRVNSYSKIFKKQITSEQLEKFLIRYFPENAFAKNYEDFERKFQALWEKKVEEYFTLTGTYLRVKNLEKNRIFEKIQEHQTQENLQKMINEKPKIEVLFELLNPEFRYWKNLGTLRAEFMETIKNQHVTNQINDTIKRMIVLANNSIDLPTLMSLDNLISRRKINFMNPVDVANEIISKLRNLKNKVKKNHLDMVISEHKFLTDDMRKTLFEENFNIQVSLPDNILEDLKDLYEKFDDMFYNYFGLETILASYSKITKMAKWRNEIKKNFRDTFAANFNPMRKFDDEVTQIGYSGINPETDLDIFIRESYLRVKGPFKNNFSADMFMNKIKQSFFSAIWDHYKKIIESKKYTAAFSQLSKEEADDFARYFSDKKFEIPNDNKKHPFLNKFFSMASPKFDDLEEEFKPLIDGTISVFKKHLPPSEYIVEVGNRLEHFFVNYASKYVNENYKFDPYFYLNLPTDFSGGLLNNKYILEIIEDSKLKSFSGVTFGTSQETYENLGGRGIYRNAKENEIFFPYLSSVVNFSKVDKQEPRVIDNSLHGLLWDPDYSISPVQMGRNSSSDDDSSNNDSSSDDSSSDDEPLNNESESVQTKKPTKPIPKRVLKNQKQAREASVKTKDASEFYSKLKSSYDIKVRKIIYEKDENMDLPAESELEETGFYETQSLGQIIEYFMNENITDVFGNSDSRRFNLFLTILYMTSNGDVEVQRLFGKLFAIYTKLSYINEVKKSDFFSTESVKKVIDEKIKFYISLFDRLIVNYQKSG